MGDRGNIAVLQSGKNQVWLYSHRGGTELPDNIRTALAKHERWTDETYLTRIVFCEAIGVKHFNETTGIGISGAVGDNEHPINVVDIPRQRVFTMPEAMLDKSGKVLDGFEPDAKCVWSFEDYVKLEPVES